MIRFIAAIDSKRGLASDAGIPWKLPKDVRYFRDMTWGGIVVMGHNTYKEFSGPLPNRRNLVVVHGTGSVRPGFEAITNVESFMENANPEDNIWIIGGAGLFASTLNYADELYLTQIEKDFKCTKFFPPYEDDFELASQSEPIVENGITYSFKIYHRKSRQ